MTAETAGSMEWAPNPVRQRLKDYTIEDVLRLPDEAPRVELDNGVVIVVPKPIFSHNDIANLLWLWFRQNAPAELRPATELGVATGFRSTLEPDVLLLRTPFPDSHFVDPSHALIVVEVVSPGTKKRDRLEKPLLYARAGIPHFWRIERDPIHVHAHDLVGGHYELVGDSDTELVLKEPFPIRLPISDITP